MSADRCRPRRLRSAETQLPPEQLARLQSLLASVVRRGSQTITTTVHMDGSGNTLSAETQRKRTPLRAAEINSWLRLLRQLAQHGLLPDDIEPPPYDLEGTVAGNELELPWEKQLIAKLANCTGTGAGDRDGERTTLIKGKTG